MPRLRGGMDDWPWLGMPAFWLTSMPPKDHCCKYINVYISGELCIKICSTYEVEVNWIGACGEMRE